MSSNLLNCPCKDCEKRDEHCHSKCKEYKEFKNERERLKKKQWLDELSPNHQRKQKRYDGNFPSRYEGYDD